MLSFCIIYFSVFQDGGSYIFKTNKHSSVFISHCFGLFEKTLKVLWLTEETCYRVRKLEN